MNDTVHQQRIPRYQEYPSSSRIEQFSSANELWKYHPIVLIKSKTVGIQIVYYVFRNYIKARFSKAYCKFNFSSIFIKYWHKIAEFTKDKKKDRLPIFCGEVIHNEDHVQLKYFYWNVVKMFERWPCYKCYCIYVFVWLYGTTANSSAYIL